MADETKTPAPANAPAPTVPVKKSKAKKVILIVIGAVVALFVIIAIVANTATSAPAKVSNSLVTYIKAGDSSAAYGLLTSAAQDTISEDAFEGEIDRIGPILTGEADMQSKEVFGETGSAATAKVVYLIKGSDSNTYEFTVNLTKEDGEWKVLNFESDKQ